MDLSHVAVVLRPRTPWEAVDLGFAMARRWFLRLWGLWLCSALPVYLASLALLPASTWLVPTLVVWWLKPLYEPPLLYWGSRATFGEELTWREMRRSWWPTVRPGLLSNLTWRRFNPFRSFHIAVMVLEGLHGRERRERMRVLGRNQHAAAWLTMLGLAFETVLELSFIVLVVLMIPDELRWADEWTLAFDSGGFSLWLGELGALMAMSLMAPFYVSAGLGLYMNRRSSLEGWDIELGFRRILATRAKSFSARGTAAACVLGLAFVLGAGASDVRAGEAPDAEEAGAVISEVLDHPDFGRERTDTYWQYVGGGERQSEEPGWFGAWVEWLLDVLQGFFKGFAALSEVVLWVAVGVALAWIIGWAIAHRGQATRSGRQHDGRRGSGPRLLDLDVSPESLPSDIPGAARELLDGGDLRGALSLLYRGMLSRFVHDKHVRIDESATEGECLELVSRARPAAENTYFADLTRQWMAMAYAHRPPDDDTVRVLCSRWGEVNDGNFG